MVKIKPKAMLAEFLGTFGLTLVVVLSVAHKGFVLSTPVLAALTLGLFVLTLGGISGTHINPAVTIGQYIIKKINLTDGISYLISQFLGAIFALLIASALTQTGIDKMELGLNIENSVLVGFGELIGAFFFTFGIASVVNNKVDSKLGAFVVGGSLLIGISVASSASLGILNPAVALGLMSFNLAYLLGPILGSIAGFYTYTKLFGK